MTKVIELKNIKKYYYKASEYSLNDISLTINKGVRLGIFGPNGAGKTTLMSILCQIIKPTLGSITYYDNNVLLNPKTFLNNMGYVPQNLSFYEQLTAYQNLRYFGALYKIPSDILNSRIEELLRVLGLESVMNNKITTFSGGMKRRINLAIGIINQPSILFLDEPTVGVDVQSNNAIMTYLEKLNAEGTTIIYTSHHLNEAESFCNKIILLDNGKLIAHDDLQKLLKEYDSADLQTLFLKLTGTKYRD